MNVGKMEGEKVAVILPSYNSLKTIDRAISSVVNQSYKNWVLYIIDDCSVDGSYDYINEKYNNPKIKLIKNNVNLGAAQTRNAGINFSKEPILAFIDSDDEWLPEKLEIQVKSLSSGNNMAVTAYNYIRNEAESVFVSYKKNKLTKNDFLKKKFRICFSSLLLHRRDGVFFESIGHEDFYYIYKNLIPSGYISVVNKAMVNYYECAGSLSSNKVKAAKWHYKILQSIYKNKIKRYYYFIWYAIKAVEFKLKVRGRS